MPKVIAVTAGTIKKLAKKVEKLLGEHPNAEVHYTATINPSAFGNTAEYTALVIVR